MREGLRYVFRFSFFAFSAVSFPIPCSTKRLTRRSNVERGSNTLRSQVRQRMPISAPRRTTRQVSPPQGCGLRICTTSPRLISSGGAGTIASYCDRRRPILYTFHVSRIRRRFSFFPQRDLLGHAHCFQIVALLLRTLFEIGEAAAKLRAGHPQRALRIDMQPPRQLGRDQEQIAELVLKPSRARGIAQICRLGRLLNLADLLVELIPAVLRIGPIETGYGCLAGQLLSGGECRKSGRNAVERLAPRLTLLGALGPFDRIPVAQNLGAARNARRAEDVRVAADQLGRDLLIDFADIEVASLARHLAVHQDAEQQVAQLLRQRGHIAGVERLQHLVRLLQQLWAQGLVGLLAIPRAAARPQ